MTDPIYHLAEPDDWAARADVYRPASLASEGFVHCSTESQLDHVAVRHFRDLDDLILLTIDPCSLGDLIVYEDLYELGDEFPHVYGPLPLNSVVDAVPYRPQT